MQYELKLTLDVTDEILFCIFGVKEKVSSGVCNLKVVKPSVEKLCNGTLLVEQLILLLIVCDVLDGLEDVVGGLDKVLL